MLMDLRIITNLIPIILHHITMWWLNMHHFTLPNDCWGTLAGANPGFCSPPGAGLMWREWFEFLHWPHPWKMMICWLVVWNMHFITFHSVGNVMIPTDELIFFRGVGSTTNQFVLMICIDDGKKICIDLFLFMICPGEFQDSHSTSH